MVGSGLGSGPFGEFVAIEWLQLVAGLPIILSGALLVLAIMKRFTGQADDHGVGAAGVIMMVASGFAAIVYLIGFACIYAGLMWEGAFPHRLPENLLGSVLFFLLGLAGYAFPRVLDRIDALRKPRHPRTLSGERSLTLKGLDMNIMLILGIGILAAFAVGYWNLRATTSAGRGADWRTNRDGLRAPGTSQNFNHLHMIAWPVVIALVVFHASPAAVMFAALAYAVGFAGLADRERRRAIIYYRGNVPDRP